MKLSFSTSSILAILVACVLSSCTTVDPNAPKELSENQVRMRVNDITSMIADGDYDLAEKGLEALKDSPHYQKEREDLAHAIQLAYKHTTNDSKKVIAERTLQDEVAAGLALPGNYGKTIVIDSTLEPFQLPKGTMETFLGKRVSIHLENATIPMLVDFLNKNGLNVVADDALGSKKTLTLRVKDVPLYEIFSYIARNMGVAFYLGENMVWITQGEEAGGPKLETRIMRLPHGFVPDAPLAAAAIKGAKNSDDGKVAATPDNDLKDALATLLRDSPKGSEMQIFKNRNILVIKNTRENIRIIEEIVREFDAPPPQVMIEARIIKIKQSDLKDVGVQITQEVEDGYDEKDKNGGPKFKETDLSSDLGEIASDNGLGTLSISGILGKRIFNMTIQAIENKESTTVLSVPRITVLNNRGARIRIGKNIYYFEEYDLATVDNGDRGKTQSLVPSGTPTELQLGMTFDVNVNIGNDGKTVMLGLRPQLLDLLGWEDYITDSDDSSSSSSSSTGMTQVKLPRTHEQSVSTFVKVNSGETVVLGGFVENSTIKKTYKVPLIGDLPLIGWLFTRNSYEDAPTNLLIFVTATVINERGEKVIVRDNTVTTVK